MICFLIIILELITKLEAKIIKVDEFQIKDLNYSSLHDEFPVYFVCDLSVMQLNFSILFRREENKIIDFTKLNLERKEIFNYESESVNLKQNLIDYEYKANAILFLNEEYYLNKTKQISFEIVMNIFKIGYENNSKSTELFLKLLLNHQRTNTSKRDVNLKNYIAIKYSQSILLVESKKKLKIKKSSPPIKKTNLKVEVCVHLHYNVYTFMKQFLNTKSYEYTRIYMSIYFAHLLNTVDKIYERLDDPAFSIRLELAELFIYTYDEVNLKKGTKSYIIQVNEHFGKQYQNKPVNCDHIFFIHRYIDGNILGSAFTTNVCKTDYFTSINLFQTNANMELTLAHELGHNLGAATHDDKNASCSFSLMNSLIITNSTGYIFSDCAKREIKSNLFENNKLKLTFNCLLEKNSLYDSKLEFYKKVSLLDSPGYFYSLSDQCRLITQNSSSFKCDINKNLDKICGPEGFSCFQTKCIGYHRALEGTVCGVNKVCQFGECVNDVKINTRSQSKFHTQINLNRNLCPQGNKQNSDILNCESLLKKKSKYDSYSMNCDIISNSFYFNSSEICCETCLKLKLKKCSAKSCKTTCEMLNKNPCFNGGKCVTNMTAFDLNKTDIAFYCECPLGFSGPLCLTISPCEMNPCKANELCFEYGEYGQYYCICSPDMFGYPDCVYKIKKNPNLNNSNLYEITIEGEENPVRFYLNIIFLLIVISLTVSVAVELKIKLKM